MSAHKQFVLRNFLRINLLVLTLVLVSLWGSRPNALHAQDNTPQVIGGQEAEPGHWPWMAALVYAPVSDAYQGQFCGGTLIAPEWVLTAAHCTHNLTPATIDVVLGRHNLTSDEGERIPVAAIINHPAYDPNTFDSDIALLKLARPSSQQPVQIIIPDISDGLIFPGVMTTVTGWGNTSPIGMDYPETLQEVSLPLVGRDICNSPAAYNGDVTLNMLCAGYEMGGEDSCKGDSGGPLMVPSVDATGWVQIGIVSWGEGCAQAYRYGVYTHVINFTDWLVTTTTPPPQPTPQLWLPLVVN